LNIAGFERFVGQMLIHGSLLKVKLKAL